MEYSSDDDVSLLKIPVFFLKLNLIFQFPFISAYLQKRMYYSVEFKPQRSSVVVDAATSTDGKRKWDAVMIEDQQVKKSRLEVNRSLSAASIPSSSFR